MSDLSKAENYIRGSVSPRLQEMFMKAVMRDVGAVGGDFRSESEARAFFDQVSSVEVKRNVIYSFYLLTPDGGQWGAFILP
ncbi:MAG: hypothetical protein KIT11_01820 [Fimbriimonadaceae bacterium]|nr:hypothetical protein [Fimbriimonadaceae bacterium]QYK54891.1 MAG: hypothetical protein KF733_07715 [Fimbriimonadaceae bacterium]